MVGSWRRWRSVEGCVGEGCQPGDVVSVGEVVQHLRARAMPLEGSTGLEEHRRRRLMGRRPFQRRRWPARCYNSPYGGQWCGGAQGWGSLGEHSVAVAVKRRRKVRLAAAQRRRGSARGAAPGATAACATRGGRKAGGARRSGSWRGRHAALEVGALTRCRDDTRRARRGKWPGGPSQSKPVWLRAGNKTTTGPHWPVGRFQFRPILF
jgi:hypothetical protein